MLERGTIRNREALKIRKQHHQQQQINSLPLVILIEVDDLMTHFEEERQKEPIVNTGDEENEEGRETKNRIKEMDKG